MTVADITNLIHISTLTTEHLVGSRELEVRYKNINETHQMKIMASKDPLHREVNSTSGPTGPSAKLDLKDIEDSQDTEDIQVTPKTTSFKI